ncbi:MAG: hypothetical protein J5525_12610 [Lachnospiraceae bacterium]|nr:hypothetical protein [Lachnospiraceae bacterium]
MKNRKIIAIAALLTMTFGMSIMAHAATSGFNSKGEISFAGPDETSNTSDDIIFDSDDLNNFHDYIYNFRETAAQHITAKNGTVSDPQSFANIESGIMSIPQTIQFQSHNASIVYMYHHHTVDSVNADSETLGGGSYKDDYVSPTNAGCFTQVLYKKHVHSGSSSSGGGCYTRPHYYWYTTGHCNGSAERHTSQGGDWQYTCSECGRWFSSDFGTGHEYGEAGDGYSVPTGANIDRIVYEVTCGKTPGVRYDSEEIEGYTCTCGKRDGQLVSARIAFTN